MLASLRRPEALESHSLSNLSSKTNSMILTTHATRFRISFIPMILVILQFVTSCTGMKTIGSLKSVLSQIQHCVILANGYRDQSSGDTCQLLSHNTPDNVRLLDLPSWNGSIISKNPENQYMQANQCPKSLQRRGYTIFSHSECTSIHLVQQYRIWCGRPSSSTSPDGAISESQLISAPGSCEYHEFCVGVKDFNRGSSVAVCSAKRAFNRVLLTKNGHNVRQVCVGRKSHTGKSLSIRSLSVVLTEHDRRESAFQATRISISPKIGPGRYGPSVSCLQCEQLTITYLQGTLLFRVKIYLPEEKDEPMLYFHTWESRGLTESSI